MAVYPDPTADPLADRSDADIAVPGQHAADHTEERRNLRALIADILFARAITGANYDSVTALVQDFNSRINAAGGVNIQLFTTAGTWIKPTGKTHVRVVCIGGGGGGGSGKVSLAANIRGGGNGGGGGAVTQMEFSAAGLPSTVPVTPGASAAGGAAVNAAATTNGNNGTIGNASYFGNPAGDYYLRADGGNFGIGGTTGTSTPIAPLPSGAGMGARSGAGGAGAVDAPTPDALIIFGQLGFAAWAPGGGGGGGGADASNVAHLASAGAQAILFAGGTTRTAGGAAGTSGTGGIGGNGSTSGAIPWLASGGGGGGCSTTGGSAAHGDGGNGGTGGGGGGGGGGSTYTGATQGHSGAGGTGGGGIVAVISW